MHDGRGTADSHQTAYRPDLDGLRAVAVLSVIAYHLSKSALPGGYLGVDIFFVLSGFLITNVIWREAANRNFSIARFYERRVRRILPALSVVLIVVSACAVKLLLPFDLKDYARSVFATLTFVANIYFWRDTGYFGKLAEEKPLLHVWSLGVEEQFYIIFPLFVLLCIRWRRSALLPLTATLVLLSLMANILAIHWAQGPAAFYLLPTRAWEIGAGALLALAAPAKILHPWLRQILALLAAALIIIGLYFKELSLGGMVPAAFWVVVGTTLAIYLGSAGGSWLTLALSRSVLVWFGLISYSLYLWHWPILVFARYYLVQSTLSPVEAAGVFLLSVSLAALSLRFVERPFRNRAMPIRSVVTWVACGCLVVAITSAATLAEKGFPSRFAPDVVRINAAVGTEFHCDLSDYITIGLSRGCLMSVASRDPADATVALVGNSHAQMFTPLVSDILRENNRGGILIPMNSCLPTPGYNESSMCMALAARNLKTVESLPHLRIVILAMTWKWNVPMYTPAGEVSEKNQTKEFIESLDRVIQDLEQSGKMVVLIGPISSPTWETASVVSRNLAFGRKTAAPLFLPEDAFWAIEGEAIQHFASRSDIIFIRPDRIQCSQSTCDYFRDGASLFADSSHIAEPALPLFRPAFEPALKQAFQRTAQ
jgi:peptidoglycan/LPS O-acetylase OafA/YrhL